MIIIVVLTSDSLLQNRHCVEFSYDTHNHSMWPPPTDEKTVTQKYKKHVPGKKQKLTVHMLTKSWFSPPTVYPSMLRIQERC